MRESIGGAFLFNLVLIFLGIYVAILSFAIVYARAFNSKNHIITLIEQYEGYNSSSSKEINNYMATRSGGTNVNSTTCCNLYMDMYSVQSADCSKAVNVIPGGCVFERTAKTTSTGLEAKTYVVTTFMRVDVPVISAFTKFFPISGESKVIYVKKGSKN